MIRSQPSAVSLRTALQRGEMTARSAVETALDRIEQHRELGAFISVNAETALAEADAADERISGAHGGAGHGLPALVGMPIAHKDLTDVAGSVTTHGSAAVPHRVADSDDPMVSQLRRSGAISLGKTQVPEFGLTGYSENLIAEPARNPLDPTRSAGGSSGGSAAAVAAGILPFAPGSDGGGSIRIPALACGIVGLKPGLGTIASDIASGVTDAFGAPRLTVSGPLARSAEDAALLFDAMTGSTRTGGAQHAVGRADALPPLDIGVSTASPFESAYEIALSPEARDALDIVIARLEARGHRIDDARLRYDPTYPEVFSIAWTSGLSLLELDADAEERLTPLTRTFRARALARSTATKHEAGARMQELAADMRAQWGRTDIVLTPGLAILPPQVGEFTARDADADFQLQCEWAPYTSMVNVSGLPAIAVPVLTLPSGLSMGVQLIGRAGSETQLLQLAAQLMAA